MMHRKLNIAFFTDSFLPEVSGVASSLASLAEALGRKGHHILIFAPKNTHIRRRQFTAKNVEIIHLPSVPFFIYPELRWGIFGLPKILYILKKFAPDILHLHTPGPVGFDALSVAKILKKPLVGTQHLYVATNDYVAWLKWVKSPTFIDLIAAFYFRYNRVFYNSCDLRLAPSKKLIEELYKVKYKKPIVYLPNGIDYGPNRIVSKIVTQQIKKKYRLKNIVILHFGRLSREKSVDQVLEAFARIEKTNSTVSLLIVGDGPVRQELEQLSRELKIDKNVTFTGFIAHQELLSSGILEIADVFVTASTMENQPMVVLEAMNAGLPVVGIKEAGMSELVTDNGILIERDNVTLLVSAIETIIGDKTVHKRMAAASKKMGKEFSSDKIADTALQLYEKLITSYQKKATLS